MRPHRQPPRQRRVLPLHLPVLLVIIIVPEVNRRQPVEHGAWLLRRSLKAFVITLALVEIAQVWKEILLQKVLIVLQYHL